MSMKMDALKDKFCKELDTMSEKRELSTTDLDRAQKLTDTIKNIYKIRAFEDEEGGYSGDGEWVARGGYSRYPRDYDRESSYRHRDSMGRYARDGYPRDGYAMDGYGRVGGYSGGTMQEHLDAMLRDAKTEDERRMIEEMRRKMM